MKATPKTILIVESQELDREGLKYRLEQNSPGGYRFLEAATTTEAVKFLEISRVDCILCNSHLGREEPIELLIRLPAVFGALYWPVILYSHRRDPRLAVKAMKLGAVDFHIREKEDQAWLSRTINHAVAHFVARPQATAQIRDLKLRLSQSEKEKEELSDALTRKSEELTRLTEKLLNQLEKTSRADESIFRVLSGSADGSIGAGLR